MLRLRILFIFQIFFAKTYSCEVAMTFPCSEYEMLIINTNKCVSRCPITCKRGICYESEDCPCDGHYMGSCSNGLICAADCLLGCKAAGGYCAASDLCICPKGYTFDELSMRCLERQNILNRCWGRCKFGKCNTYGECVCAQGYKLSTTLLGTVCAPICKSDCGPHAYCHMPNMCACRKKHYHYGRDGKCHKAD